MLECSAVDGECVREGKWVIVGEGGRVGEDVLVGGVLE